MTALPADTDRRPRFTVLVPTHNRADVLTFAIESALQQTEQNFELLVAGDGCTDETADVVGSFQDPRIRWMDLPKAPGIAYATRNAALRHARGHYVAYLAHDDLWFSDHLERLGSLLDRHGVELVHSRLVGVDVDGALRPYAYNLEVPSHRRSLSRARAAISISCVAHQRSCLDKYGYWDEQLLRGGDIEMWHRIAGSGQFKNVAFCSEPTALHFVADWRSTTSAVARRHVARRVADGLLADGVPRALRLELRTGEPPQKIALRQLRENGDAFVRGIRHAVVQYHDALLWRSHSTAGVMAFRAGASLGVVVDRFWHSVLWLSSRDWRRWHTAVRRRMRRIDDQVRLDARTPGGGGG